MPNLRQQDVPANGPDRKRAGDITVSVVARTDGATMQLWTGKGRVCPAVIIDLFSGRVVGRAISNRMGQDLAIRALNTAIALRRPPPDQIRFTDRGSQYCAHYYRKTLRGFELVVSMSGKGNCYDNPAVESFFKSPKAGLDWRHTRRNVEIALFEYISGFYDPHRKHSALR